MASLPPDAPRPRLCKIRKDFPEQDYGFNLHADRSKGQFIGSIDAGSPAEFAGLRTGDRIVAVNSVSVSAESHKQVVARIKEHPLECALLVIDEHGELWYRERKLPIPVYQDFGNGTLDKKVVNGQENSERKMAVGNAPPTYREATEKNVLRPRLCKLVKPYPEAEFGFNLHAEKNTGHYIGKVDKDSVAEKAGLEEGQRIVGVNGTLVYPTTPNREVVQTIKSQPTRTELLLASPEVDNWYRMHGKEYSFQEAEVIEPMLGRMAQVTLTKSPPPTIVENGVATSNGVHNHQEEKVVESPLEEQKEVQVPTKPPEPVKPAPAPAPEPEPVPVPVPAHVPAPAPAPAPAHVPKPVEESKKEHEEVKDKEKAHDKPSKSERLGASHFRSSVEHNPEVQAHLYHQDWMNLSAAELRERVSRHKKPDARTQQLSLLQKYEIVHNL